MKELFAFLSRFVRPYRRNLLGSVVYNLLSAILNVFSFALIVPILRILFKISTEEYEYIPLSSTHGVKEMVQALRADFFCQVTGFIDAYGESRTLLLLGLVLIFMTLLKTACYFGASAVMVPLRNGVVRDIRVQIYDKILSLPMGFFSKERKGDIITRMSGDVSEIENSIAQSLDMLIKNPILIIVYLGTLIAISWQMTIFTIIIGPIIIWVMGSIGRKLKAKSLLVQSYWSETMSELEETLGGLRVIKAFLAERKMSDRFGRSSESLRKASNRVHMRQALAHPVSEFMGTALIVVVLWFGGTLILDDRASIDASTFIWYMTILYSVINPIKDFSKAGYGSVSWMIREPPSMMRPLTSAFPWKDPMMTHHPPHSCVWTAERPSCRHSMMTWHPVSVTPATPDIPSMCVSSGYGSRAMSPAASLCPSPASA